MASAGWFHWPRMLGWTALAQWSRSPRLLRRLARRERRRGDLAADLFYRRRLCSIKPQAAGNWLQLAHAYKDLGLATDAEAAYREAIRRSADTQAPLSSLGFFLKTRGRWAEAAACFQAAIDLAPVRDAGLTAEVEGLARLAAHPPTADSAVIFPVPTGPGDRNDVHVYLSSPLELGRRADSSLLPVLGKADYSYAYAMRGFLRALRASGATFTILQNVEIIPDIGRRSAAAINIHLGFYPPERLRLLKGAYNVNCFAWEFDRLRLPAETADYHAFADQATMLNLADELWIPSRHGVEAVSASVSPPTAFVPSPILGAVLAVPRSAPPSLSRVTDLSSRLRTIKWQPLAAFARLQPAFDIQAKQRETGLPEIIARIPADQALLLFTTILNVHDFRKQLYPMLEGFCRFQRRCERAILLVKLTTPDRAKMSTNRFILMDQVLDGGELPRPLVSDRVWITDDILDDDQLLDLYDASSFYVCTSYAEGQNLPLLEAMGRGVVPVSVNHTAMADYIEPSNAVIVPSFRAPMGPRLSARYRLFGLETNMVDPAAVMAAFETAASMPMADYADRSAAALDTVTGGYGVSGFSRALQRTIERARNARAARAAA